MRDNSVTVVGFIFLLVVFVALATMDIGYRQASVDTSTPFGRCLHDCSAIYGGGDLSIKCQAMCNNPLHTLDDIK